MTEHKDVFISYKAEDFEQADWVRSTLETNGISCWMAPSCIPGGSSYAVEIPQAIRGCKVFVLVLSAKAQESKWVPREVDQAINEGKTIMPFVLENCVLRDDFNFYLTNVQRYAAYENKAAAIEKMLREIRAVLGIAEPVPAAAATPASAPVPPVTPVAPPKPATKVKARMDPLAIVSMIVSVLSMLSLGFLVFPSLVAVILAVAASFNMKKQGTQGKALAAVGLTLGLLSGLIGLIFWFQVIGFVLWLVIGIASVLLFVLHPHRTSGT